MQLKMVMLKVILMNIFHILKPHLSSQKIIMKYTLYYNPFIKKIMIIFWMLNYIWFIAECWLLLIRNFIQFKLSFFHKHGGEYFGVTNCLWHLSMFFPTRSNVKSTDGNTGHTQGIGIILCWFTNCTIIYTVGPFY